MKTFLFSFLSIAIIVLFFFSCQKEVGFEYGTVSQGSDDNTAIFILQGTPGVCMNDSVSGSYITGLVMNAGNYVLVSVDVTSPGTYTVSTDIVNGYSFSVSGIFSTTGIQTISLAASGIPLNTGTDVFTVTAGSSSCHFSVPVVTAVTTTSNDLFPLTTSSYWDYKDLYRQGSFVKTEIIDTIRGDGHLYKVMEEQISPNGPRLFFYRKSGPDYFEHIAIDKYTVSMQYNKLIYDELLFLNENLTAGNGWQSHEYSDTAGSGQVIGLQYNYVCLEADVSMVINGFAFAHVYKVEMRPRTKTLGNVYMDTGEIYTYYYARGIGLIYYKQTSSGSSTGELQIKGWQVN